MSKFFTALHCLKSTNFDQAHLHFGNVCVSLQISHNFSSENPWTTIFLIFHAVHAATSAATFLFLFLFLFTVHFEGHICRTRACLHPMRTTKSASFSVLASKTFVLTVDARINTFFHGQKLTISWYIIWQRFAPIDFSFQELLSAYLYMIWPCIPPGDVPFLRNFNMSSRNLEISSDSCKSIFHSPNGARNNFNHKRDLQWIPDGWNRLRLDF